MAASSGESADIISLKIHTTEIGDEHPVRVMGILNVSPESFYSGSVSRAAGVAQRARGMVEAGATFLDIGARSTAPRAAPITVEEERNRITAALEALFSDYDVNDVLVSVDTQFRSVAERAFELCRKAGKERQFVLNDVSCLRADPDLAPWIAQVDCPVILMAAHERPGDSLGVAQTIADLQSGTRALREVGVDTASRLIVDPAIGRWTRDKTAAHDCELIRELESFRRLGAPILVGISRKSFIGDIVDRADPATRLAGTQAATAVAVFRGAHIVRTHDVSTETLDTVRVAWSIRTGRIAPVRPAAP